MKPCPCHYDDCHGELFHGVYEWVNVHSKTVETLSLPLWWLQIWPTSIQYCPNKRQGLFSFVAWLVYCIISSPKLLLQPCPCHYDDCYVGLFHGVYEWANVHSKTVETLSLSLWWVIPQCLWMGKRWPRPSYYADWVFHCKKLLEPIIANVVFFQDKHCEIKTNISKFQENILKFGTNISDCQGDIL